MKRLALVLLFASPAFADGMMVVRRTAPVATADVFSETFDASGFDLGGWTQPCAANCGTSDPDETVLCPAGTGFANACYQASTSEANRVAWAIYDIGSARTDQLYQTIYFSFKNMTATGWADGESQTIVFGHSVNSGSPSIFTAAFSATLVYDADGAMAPSPACSPLSACWRLEMKIGGTSEADKILQVVPDGTIYRLRYSFDAGASTGNAFLDSTQTVTNQDASFSYQYLWLGQIDASQDAGDMIFDGATCSTNGFVP